MDGICGGIFGVKDGIGGMVMADARDFDIFGSKDFWILNSPSSLFTHAPEELRFQPGQQVWTRMYSARGARTSPWQIRPMGLWRANCGTTPGIGRKHGYVTTCCPITVLRTSDVHTPLRRDCVNEKEGSVGKDPYDSGAGVRTSPLLLVLS